MNSPTYFAFIFVAHRGKFWLFQKKLPQTMVVPFPGMQIVDWDGNGESVKIISVEWYPRSNEVHLRLEDDKWSPEAKWDPEEEYRKYGWALVDGPDAR